MIEIFLLEQLVAFARNGTLTKAAEELHISQPALSRSMKKLEEEFGVPLFDREKSRIALNEVGKVAARYAQRVLEADREMVERTVAYERSRRTVVFGACTLVAVNTMMPVLQECFRGRAITSEIADDDRLLAGLRHHVYQLVVLHRDPQRGQETGEGRLGGKRPDREGSGREIFSKEIFGEQLCITLPEGHALADREAVSFRELVESSSLPAFHSDRALERGYDSGGRVTLPITDEEAYARYYLACLREEKGRYEEVFRRMEG